MLGKTVKAEPGLVQFFYPSFEVRTKLDYTDKNRDVLYMGPSRANLADYLTANCKRFISLSGAPEINLSDAMALVTWALTERNKALTEAIKSQIQALSYEEILYYVKYFWVTGQWMGEKSETPAGLFHLFKSVPGSLKDELAMAFELMDNVPISVIEGSFLTFLLRVKTVSEQEVSPAYKKVLVDASAKSGAKIRSSISNYVQFSGNRQLAFIDLLLSLR